LSWIGLNLSNWSSNLLLLEHSRFKQFQQARAQLGVTDSTQTEGDADTHDTHTEGTHVVHLDSGGDALEVPLRAAPAAGGIVHVLVLDGGDVDVGGEDLDRARGEERRGASCLLLGEALGVGLVQVFLQKGDDGEGGDAGDGITDGETGSGEHRDEDLLDDGAGGDRLGLAGHDAEDVGVLPDGEVDVGSRGGDTALEGDGLDGVILLVALGEGAGDVGDDIRTNVDTCDELPDAGVFDGAVGQVIQEELSGLGEELFETGLDLVTHAGDGTGNFSHDGEVNDGDGDRGSGGDDDGGDNIGTDNFGGEELNLFCFDESNGGFFCGGGCHLLD